MNLIQFNDVNKEFNGEKILKDISFNINLGDKIGLVGLNGIGKTTLIKMMLGEERYTGNIFVNSKCIIGYLSQNYNFENEDNLVYDELFSVFKEQKEIFNKIELILSESNLSEKKLEEYSRLNDRYQELNGYDIEYRIKQVMQGLYLNDFKDRKIKKLSGGEKTRINLAKLLLKEPDLLILDEPTNHLDIVSIEWLEEFLKKYNKSFILISHDRIFLDVVCNKIFEIENKKMYTYDGNFSSFILQKELYLKGEIKRYEKESEKIRKIEEYVTRYKAGIKSKQARGRQKILDRMERMDDPIFNPNRMKLKFNIDNASADIVLKLENISKSYNDKKVLKNISFNVYKGDKIGIIGKNGIGKSTLLKILNGDIKEYDGNFVIGNRVKVGYYDQEHRKLFNENNILQEINTSINYTEEQLRSKAASFLFYKEDMDKKISKLSGGEKSRVSLLKLAEEKANFLLLDEPTNHLDFYSIEILEDALIDYEGSFLLISHNRHFINSVCNKIYYLSEEGVSEFKGNYDIYKEVTSVKKEKKEVNSSYEEMKEKQKNEKKRKREFEKLEKEMEEVSLKLKELDKKMQKAGYDRNLELVLDIQSEIDKLKLKEDELFEKWENLEYEDRKI